MSHDIPTIIINKALKKELQKANGPKVAHHTGNTTNLISGSKKIDAEDDLPKLTTVGRETGQLISQARCAKGLKQTDLAKQLNVTPDIIRDYENGSAPRNGNLLNKMGTILGIKLTGKN